jgi:hypothetical protein
LPSTQFETIPKRLNRAPAALWPAGSSSVADLPSSVTVILPLPSGVYSKLQSRATPSGPMRGQLGIVFAGFPPPSSPSSRYVG